MTVAEVRRLTKIVHLADLHQGEIRMTREEYWRMCDEVGLRPECPAPQHHVDDYGAVLSRTVWPRLLGWQVVHRDG